MNTSTHLSSAAGLLNVEEKCKKRISQRDYSIKEVKMVKRDRYHKVPVVVLRKKSGSMSTVDLESLLSDSDERVRVEFFTNEKSLKERLQLYFIKNQRSSLRIRIFNLVIKLLTCALYIVRVCMDGLPLCRQFPNGTVVEMDDCWMAVDTDRFQENPSINWNRIFWVNRSSALWIVQVTVAIISLVETILVQYLSYKGNILQQVLSWEFLLELINTVPFVVTIFWEPLRSLFIPVFLNCWLAKNALQNMFNDLHRVMMKSQSALAQQLMILCATVLCLVFTSVCGIQHLQRGGNQQFGLFESCWFSVVTFSTVGYGDICPDIWISQFFMICMIGAALIVLPTQFEQLAFFWLERQKQGGAYSSHRAQTEKHVVVCTTTLQADTVMDFLNEFYAHPKLQDYYVVLLSPCELDSTMKMLLQVPLWTQRVIYIQGSALKDSDLTRCRMQDALACFILAARNQSDRTAADQHTILRSWAIKDFAPDCAQYVQIFRPENKFHVKFAEHVVCEDEFKYALLAYNCMCPATSTLVTLLLHTSRGHEGQASSEEWQRLYGGCSGNEIYHIRLRDSKFFGEYEGNSFTYASFHAHRRFGVSLVGIQQSDVKDANIQLNPGPRHIMKKSDICFYLNITKEENTRTFNLAQSQEEGAKMDQQNLPAGAKQASRVASMIASVGTVALELQHTRVNIPNPSEVKQPSPPTRTGSKKFQLDLPKGLNIASLQKRPSIAPVPAVLEANDIRIQLSSDIESEEDEADIVLDTENDHDSEYIRGFPPITPYVGTSPTLCHLMKEKRPLCCLQIANACKHCSHKNTREYDWPNRAIILAADFASNGIYNFVVPLRSHARPKNSLNPIVLMLGNKPDTAFLDTICHFPLVFWMSGSIDSIDNLLQAGINMADNVVIVNKETSNSAEEDTLADCNTIVGVQTIFRLFPSANIITELSQSSNMRFMQFRANDTYSYTLSKMEKKERSRGSHLSYMFRLPFAAGNVFSASMLDTLLYQAFVKDYLITFVRLLLGIDQAVGSGHLSCMKIKKDDLWIRTYGRLYQKLCSTTCEIPIGIYRTQVHEGGESNTPNASMVVRDQSALNLAFRNSVIRRKPRGSTTSTSASNKKQENVSLSMMGMEHDEHDAHMTPERHEISQMVKSRMQSLGLPMTDYDNRRSNRRKRDVGYNIVEAMDVNMHDKVDCGNEKRNNISYVMINPGYDLCLELNDIIYLIRPSSLSPEASPLMDERRFHQHRHAMGTRVEPTGADNSDQDSHSSSSVKPTENEASTSRKVIGGIMKDSNSRIPVIYMDDESDDNDDTSTQPEQEASPCSTTTGNGQPHFHLGDIDNDTGDSTEEQTEKHVEGLSGTVV